MRKRGAVDKLEGGEVSRNMWKLVDFPLKKILSCKNYNSAPCFKNLMGYYIEHLIELVDYFESM
jgi:hypothetical protein